MKEINITDNESGCRLDKFLLKYMNKAPKSFVYKMIRKKRIKLNGKRAEGNEIIKSGDAIQMYISDDTALSFMEKRDLRECELKFGIVYEDNNILIVNKPAGVLSQPDSSEKDYYDAPLTEQILYYLYKKEEYIPHSEDSFTPAIANRIDRNTSGIITVGKNPSALRQLNSAMAERHAQKVYITIVKGEIKKSGSINSSLYKYNDSNTSKPSSNGKEALTYYKPIEAKNGFTLLEVTIVTGRTHQIRAHLSHISHSVIGDRKYGDIAVNSIFREKYGLNNQLLHAYKISFDENAGDIIKNKSFEAPPSRLFKSIASDLGFKL